MDPRSMIFDHVELTLITSEFMNQDFNLNVNYDEQPPVFLAESFNADFFFTLSWSENINEYSGSGQLRCTVCDGTDISEYRASRTARVSKSISTSNPVDCSDVGDTQVVICEDCAKETDKVARELARTQTDKVIRDYI